MLRQATVLLATSSLTICQKIDTQELVIGVLNPLVNDYHTVRAIWNSPRKKFAIGETGKAVVARGAPLAKVLVHVKGNPFRRREEGSRQLRGNHHKVVGLAVKEGCSGESGKVRVRDSIIEKGNTWTETHAATHAATHASEEQYAGLTNVRLTW